MRGHVTKINFTNRRQRKAEARAAEIASARATAAFEDQDEVCGQSIALPLMPTVSDPCYYAQLCTYTLLTSHSHTSADDRSS